MSCICYEDQSVKTRMRVVALFSCSYYYYYYYYYLLQLSFHSMAVVLTLVQTKQIKNKYT
jgi:hypothetical protein